MADDFWDKYIDSLDATPSQAVQAKSAVGSAGSTVKSALLRDVPVAAQGAVDLVQRPFQRADVLREMGIDPVEYAQQQIRDPKIEDAVDARLREMSDAPELATSIDNAYGFTPRESQTPGQRIASDAIVGGTIGLATAPLGGGVLPGIASGALGAAGSGAARELGLGERGQFAAGVVAGASPAAFARGPMTGPVVQGIARRATGTAASEAMDEAASLMRKLVGVDDSALTASVKAEKMSGSLKSPAEVSKIKGHDTWVVSGHGGPPELYGTEQQALKRASEFDSLEESRIGSASLSQIVGTDSALAAEGRAVSASPQFAERLLAQRRSNADALRQAESDLYSGGTDPGEGLVAAREASKQGVDAAYDSARQIAATAGEVPTANINRIARTMTAENAAFLRSRIPKETFEALERFAGGRAPINELDNLSRSLTQTLKDLSRAGDDQGVRLASQLKKAVDADFTAAATRKVAPSRAAQAFIDAKATQAAHADLFSLDHPAVSSLIERTGVGNAVRSRENPQLLTNLRKNPSEAFRLRRALAGDPDSLEGAQRLALNDLLGGKPLVGVPGGSPGANIHTVIREAEKPATAAALRGLLDDTGYEGLMTMLRRTRQLTTTGADVSRRQAFRIIEDKAAYDGSALGVIVADAAVGLKAPVARGVVRAFFHAAGAPRRFFDATTVAQRSALLEKAMLGDLDTIDLLLARPRTDVAIKQWNQKLQTALFTLDVGRSAVRATIEEQRP